MSEDIGYNKTVLKPRRAKVAIIGASYAGLTLANFLKKHSISFVIFESSPCYYVDDYDSTVGAVLSQMKSNWFVIGPFILPSFRYIANELGININRRTKLTKKDIYTNSGLVHAIDHCYERSDIMSLLLENVKECIKFNTCIKSIICKREENKQPSFFCSKSHHASHNDDVRTDICNAMGPFEYIIAADGVKSIIGSSHSYNDNNVLLIGDARWVNDSWYDFGFHRTKVGADVAMNDGLELGEILKSLLGHVPNGEAYDNHNVDGFVCGENSSNIVDKVMTIDNSRKFKKKGILVE